ncbi:PhlB family protein [Halopiger aswanensis]|uniref:DUF35 domain-containing protein n=1 Tax=Halopiger aswanensis TaxID=148449 RepID=A0A3R7HFT2_9EURY|nr:hypothetical protein [Halopiger aswanensis]RKD88036.1 hypothetical protein ATJ93_4527 [Halopiger aswanensis]
MTDVLECANCGQRTFYEKQRCLDCGNDTFCRRDPGTGMLQAVTAVHVTPDDVREPNRLGLASFDGTNIIAQLDDSVQVGELVSLAEADARIGTEPSVKLVAVNESDRNG